MFRMGSSITRHCIRMDCFVSAICVLQRRGQGFTEDFMYQPFGLGFKAPLVMSHLVQVCLVSWSSGTGNREGAVAAVGARCKLWVIWGPTGTGCTQLGSIKHLLAVPTCCKYVYT